jgi:uncharacterized protein (TIGR02271 family)
MTGAYGWRDRTVIDRNGEKVGKIDELYLDHQSDNPAWASVHTGLLSTKRSLLPLSGARPKGEDVQVPVFKEQVEGAPSVEPDAELSEREEIELYEYYGVPYPGEGAAITGATPSPAVSQSEGRNVSDRSTSDAMTRSEEEVHVGKAFRERGRVRLRKYVVTEEVQQTVPVRREEVRVEREPITDANLDPASDGPAISEDQHEVVLHEEEVVTTKRTVPKERVRLAKDVVTEEQQVSDEVRKERIDIDTGRGGTDDRG